MNKLVQEPYKFNQEDLRTLLDSNLEHSDIENLLLRILDMNQIAPSSDKGILAWLNRWSIRKRNHRFFKKIRQRKTNEQYKVILAEGDSWLEYPFFVKDIIDHLSKRKDYAIYSLAEGGDWLVNMLRNGKYIEQMNILKPDVLLLSGGGNDLLANNRLAAFVDTQLKIPEFNLPQWVYQVLESKVYVGERMKRGLRFLNKDFYALLWCLEVQYRYIIENINKKYPSTKIIVHGYDYPIPSLKKSNHLLSRIVGLVLPNGRWLYQPLQLAGITEQVDKEAVLYTLLFLFNELLENIAKDYTNVEYVDCRLTVPQDGWFDELHPNSRWFGVIAKKFEKRIDGDINDKVKHNIY